MKSKYAWLLSVGLVGVLSAGCGAESPSGEQTSQASEQVVGVDTFLYFRSNATGWGVDESTRLLPFAAPNVFARAVTPNQPWMVTDGDTAIVTETNQLDGWGTQQTYSGPNPKSIVEPQTAPLVPQAPGGDAHFNVKYSSQLLQRVLVNLQVTPPTLTVEPISCSCPSPTHCVIGTNSMPSCAL